MRPVKDRTVQKLPLFLASLALVGAACLWLAFHALVLLMTRD